MTEVVYRPSSTRARRTASSPRTSAARSWNCSTTTSRSWTSSRCSGPLRKDPDPDHLYNTADQHWGHRGTRVIAKEVADRVARYKFGTSARYGLPVVRAAPENIPAVSDEALFNAAPGWAALSEQQRARARAAQGSSYSHVTAWDGREPPDDRESPVHVIGNSFAQHFREHLVKETNLLVCSRWRLGGTTEAFGDFLREPELLKHCKVVVWVTSDRHLADFKPLPETIMATLRATDRPR